MIKNHHNKNSKNNNNNNTSGVLVGNVCLVVDWMLSQCQLIDI